MRLRSDVSLVVAAAAELRETFLWSGACVDLLTASDSILFAGLVSTLQACTVATSAFGRGFMLTVQSYSVF